MAVVIARSLSRSLPRVARHAAPLARAPLSLARMATRPASQWLARSLDSRRAFSSAGGDEEASAAEPMEENRFMDLADDTLNDIQTWLDGIEEMLEESDVSFSQGVLKIDLGEHGTWVLNRQVPNRQIWWSSPISGPRRYEFDATSGKWLNTRDKTEMFERLQDEIADVTGISIFH